MCSNARFSLTFVVVALLTLCALEIQAQEVTDNPHAVTGCVQKGIEAGGFFIVEDGKMWELAGKVDAGDVGHKVTATGHVLHRSAAKEAKFAEHEKQESSGKWYGDFQVTSLKVVSDSCQ